MITGATRKYVNHYWLYFMGLEETALMSGFGLGLTDNDLILSDGMDFHIRLELYQMMRLDLAGKSW